MENRGGGEAEHPAAAPDSYTIAGLEMGLSALHLLRDRDVTTVSELSALLGVARSRAHRILRTLEHSGFVAPAASGRGFVTGRALMGIAEPFGTGTRSRALNRPVVAAVMEATGESVHTAVLIGAQLLVTDGRRSRHDLDIGLRVGMMMPAHSMAGGKLLLSRLDDAQVREILPATLSATGPFTIRDREELIRELARVRAEGFALSLRESEHGVDSVAFLLRGSSWRDRTALVVSAPAERGGRERMRSLAADTRRALEDLAAAGEPGVAAVEPRP